MQLTIFNFFKCLQPLDKYFKLLSLKMELLKNLKIIQKISLSDFTLLNEDLKDQESASKYKRRTNTEWTCR